MRLIDGDALLLIFASKIKKITPIGYSRDAFHHDSGRNGAWVSARSEVNKAPTIDAVPVEQYNDLRDDFIDYVCSGVPNPAPYCGNATEKCVDARGWCVNSECKGFAPRGERKE